MENRRRTLITLGLAYIALLIAVFVGVVILVTQPETLGYISQERADSTATESARAQAVAQRTFDANDLIATRAFDLNQTVTAERGSLDATATQNAADIPATFESVAQAITGTAERAVETLDALSTSNALNAQGTAAALISTQDANLQAAANAIESRATLEFQVASFERQMTQSAQQAFSTRSALESTAVGLDSRVTAVAQVETQAALNLIATQTQSAARNQQEATRAAESYAGTQAAYAVQATQVELEFQGTQAALAAEATKVALTFEATAPPAESSGDVTATLDLTLDLQDGAFLSESGGRWTLPDPSAWRLDAQGHLIAFADPAILRSEQDAITDYTLTFAVTPMIDGDTYALLRIPNDDRDGIALHIVVESGQMTRATLIRFGVNDLSAGGLLGNGAGVLFSAETNPIAQLAVTINVTGSRVVVDVDGETRFATDVAGMSASGGVGLQLPQDAALTMISLTDSLAE